MIVGANILNDLGVIWLAVQPFYPIANIVGGYVFGLGIVMVGGCGSGVWYKIGEGQFNSLIAVIGFFIGINMTATGVLSPVYRLLKSVRVPVAGHKFPTLWHIFGDGTETERVYLACGGSVPRYPRNRRFLGGNHLGGVPQRSFFHHADR
jgi:uncharacterized membrane protein YedE/YeeE